jgi:hypothetical protein
MNAYNEQENFSENNQSTISFSLNIAPQSKSRTILK